MSYYHVICEVVRKIIKHFVLLQFMLLKGFKNDLGVHVISVWQPYKAVGYPMW